MKGVEGGDALRGRWSMSRAVCACALAAAMRGGSIVVGTVHSLRREERPHAWVDQPGGVGASKKKVRGSEVPSCCACVHRVKKWSAYLDGQQSVSREQLEHLIDKD